MVKGRKTVYPKASAQTQPHTLTCYPSGVSRGRRASWTGPLIPWSGPCPPPCSLTARDGKAPVPFKAGRAVAAFAGAFLELLRSNRGPRVQLILVIAVPF